MRLLFYRSFILILLVFAATTAVAQDEATSKFIDSASKPAVVVDSVVTSATDTVVTNSESVEDSTATELVDTAIVSNLRSINKDSFSLIKKDKGFYYQRWLDSLLRAKENIKPEEPKELNLPNLGLFFSVFETILWILAAAIVFFVIYKLFLGKGALFVKNRKNIDVAIETGEEPTGGHYENLLRKAEESNNYRLAVRYHHLQALYNLSQRGYVVFGTDKTNYQYISELRRAMPSIVNVFSNLTNKYEYIWYGEYAITAQMYDTLKNEFSAFNHQIG